MTIIVTGGAGFIGSNFVFHMLKKYPDYRIVCLDCLTYAGNLSTLAPVMDNPNFRFVKESITDREAVYKLFEEEHPDIVPGIGHDSGGFYFVQKSAETITDRRGFGKGSCCEKGDVAMPLFQKCSVSGRRDVSRAAGRLRRRR